jgi:hypothetical protein
MVAVCEWPIYCAPHPHPLARKTAQVCLELGLRGARVSIGSVCRMIVWLSVGDVVPSLVRHRRLCCRVDPQRSALPAPLTDVGHEGRSGPRRPTAAHPQGLLVLLLARALLLLLLVVVVVVVLLLLLVVPAVVPAVMLLVGTTGRLYVTPPPRCSPSPPWRAGFCFVRSSCSLAFCVRCAISPRPSLLAVCVCAEGGGGGRG